METVGDFEYNKKDLVGHGAYAVVFKGRHKKKKNWEVAIKSICKKNLSKSQFLLGKEIKILKELNHENIVALYDVKETSSSVFLVMEYCNGGDLADYLQVNGRLREDVLQELLRQISAAMQVLHSKGIVHRDLKPQNILLSHKACKSSNPTGVCVKIGDFGFARHLQSNMMAATLCGSPMYMAPEVIMSHSYGAKADLWSIGAVVYQCLVGRPPFQASSPQELRFFYERSKNMAPEIPAGTSPHLTNLLLGLLQKDQKNRMDFDTFFSHPFLMSAAAVRKSYQLPVASCTGSALNQSPSHRNNSTKSAELLTLMEQEEQLDTAACKQPQMFKQSATLNRDVSVPSNLSSNIRYVSPVGIIQQRPSSSSHPLKAASKRSSSTYHLTREPGQRPCCECQPTELRHLSGECLLTGRSSILRRSSTSPVAFPRVYLGSSCATDLVQTVSVHRYTDPSQPYSTFLHVPQSQMQRTLSQTTDCSTRRKLFKQLSDPLHNISSAGQYACPSHQSRPSSLGASPARQPGSTPRFFDWWLKTPLPTIIDSPTKNVDPFKVQQTLTSCSQLGPLPRSHSVCCHQGHAPVPRARHPNRGATRSYFGRSVSAGRLSERPVIMGLQRQPLHCSTDCLEAERLWDTATIRRMVGRRGSTTLPKGVVISSPTPSLENLTGFTAPELPEETLMEQEHADTLAHLRTILSFTNAVMEMATLRVSSVGFYSPQDSVVVHQVGQLSQQWGQVEQLVLYMKVAQLQESALHLAKAQVKQAKLHPSTAVKQVVRTLNENYKTSVASCRHLTECLHRFFSDKQHFVEEVSIATAEKLIYDHAVEMVQSTALDEMFHQGRDIGIRYSKASVLLDGLSKILSDPVDIENLRKFKASVDHRIAALT